MPNVLSLMVPSLLIALIVPLLARPLVPLIKPLLVNVPSDDPDADMAVLPETETEAPLLTVKLPLVQLCCVVTALEIVCACAAVIAAKAPLRANASAVNLPALTSCCCV